MTYFIYANNVNTTLAGAVSASSTSLTLSSSANLPSSIPAGAVFVITLNDRATGQNYEIIYATAISGATLSGLLRGQDGTAAQSWLTNDYAYSAPTAGEMNGFGQLGSSNTWAGPNTFVEPVVVAPASTDNEAAQFGQVVKTVVETVLTSGSGTYTTPPDTKWLRVRLLSAGGGGASSGTGASNGGNGGPTTFGGFTVSGGAGGTVGGAGGIGGNSAGNAVSVTGAKGGAGLPTTAFTAPGGYGGVSAFGGAGAGGGSGSAGGNGTSAQANSGSGGGGASGVSGSVGSSGGGGSGGYGENWIISPAASYSYSVGAAGAGSSTGASFAGGDGGNGQLIIEAFI